MIGGYALSSWAGPTVLGGDLFPWDPPDSYLVLWRSEPVARLFSHGRDVRSSETNLCPQGPHLCRSGLPIESLEQKT